MDISKNIKLYYIIEFLQSGQFATAIWIFFFTQHLDFSLGWSIFFMTLPGIISLVFEIYTGILSDNYSRKKLLIVSIICMIIGTSFYLFSTQIYQFIIASLFIGIGLALESGNLSSLIHDQLENSGQKNTEKEFQKISSNGESLFFVGRLLGVASGGYLFLISPILPFIMKILFYMGALAFCFFIDDVKVSAKNTTKNHLNQAVEFLKENLHVSYFLLLSGIIFSAIGNIFWFTRQAYLQEVGLDITDIGYIYILCAFFSILGSFTSKYLFEHFSKYRIMRFLIIGMFLSSVLYAQYNLIPLIIAMALGSISFGMITPLAHSYFIRHAPKTHKATLLSIYSFTVAGGYFILSTSIGFLTDYISLKSIFSIIPIFFFLFIIFDLFKYYKLKSTQEHHLYS